jgi:predicted NUDIX family NTP pyrophosphohydrolase
MKYPEIDGAEYSDPVAARQKIHAAQRGLVDELEQIDAGKNHQNQPRV